MKRSGRIPLALAALSLALVGTMTTVGATNSKSAFKAELSGYEEVPSVSTAAAGEFGARVSGSGLLSVIDYELTYTSPESPAGAAHIHLGQMAANGGVSAFLCGGGDKPPCPPTGGTVAGTIDAADVIGPGGQGIAAGEIEELIAAMRAGVTYANVHTNARPGGEIRGQIN